MTDPTPTEATPQEPPLPPESRAARSLTDRSRPDGPHTGDGEAHPEPERGPRIWPRVVGVLILLLGVGGAWVWQNPGFLHATFGSLFPGAAGQDDDAAAIKTIEARVARLEQRPVAADLTPLTQRLDALEKRGGAGAPVDLRPLQTRMEALEARVSGSGAPPAADATSDAEPDLGPLNARLRVLEKILAERTVAAAKVDVALAQVQAQLRELSAHDPGGELRGRLDDVASQLKELADNGAKTTQSSSHALWLARLQAASIALESGQALGPLPDAPPALTRFAATAPPTMAALRLAFPPAAREALKVSKPDTEGKPFLDRVIARLQDFKLVTVREGDRVLIGNAAVAILAQAKALLDAGDLSGAAREVATLSGAPKEQMAPWLADATALVAAREALASLAGSN